MHTWTLITVISAGLMVGLTLAIPLIQEQDSQQLANKEKTSEEMREILQRLFNPDQGGSGQRVARAARDDSSNTSEDKSNDSSSSSEEKGKKRRTRSASDETSEEKDHKSHKHRSTEEDNSSHSSVQRTKRDTQENSSSSSEEDKAKKGGKGVRRRKRDTSLEAALDANSDQLLASEEAVGQLFEDPLPNEDDYVRGCGVIDDSTNEANNDSME